MLGVKQLQGCRIRRFWHVRAAQVLPGQEASQSKLSTGVKASTEAKCGQVYSLSLRKSCSAHGQMGYILLPFCNCGRVVETCCVILWCILFLLIIEEKEVGQSES